MSRRRVAPIPGSAPHRSTQHSRLGPADSDDQLAIRVVLRPRPLAASHRLSRKLRRWMAGEPERFSEAEFRYLQAPSKDDVRALVDYARYARLDVAEVSQARHDVLLVGRSKRVEAAFGVEFELFDSPVGPRRSHRGEVHLPRRLHQAVVGVLGLDDLPRSGPAARLVSGKVARTYSPRTIARQYRFPTVDCRGQRIAILEFGGGFHRDDLDHYFKRALRLTPPTISTLALGGAANAPIPRDQLAKFVDAFNDPQATAGALTKRFGQDTVAWAKATLEVTLDIQIAAVAAPGATLKVIFADSGSVGFYDAIYTAAGLGPGRCRRTSVISISWGTSEAEWGGHLGVIDQALRAAALRGITVVCSSGDFGSLNHPSAKQAQVNYPASSGYALAVGGTSMVTPPLTADHEEVVWNRYALGMRCASGGGLSGYWARPTYQSGIIPLVGGVSCWRHRHAATRGPFRAVPDASAVADSVGGYRIWLGGRRTIGAGTSAATPLWAGLVARLRRATRSRLGWLTPLLYRPEFADGFTDIVRGHNQINRQPGFHAHPGWDCCTGNGTPKGDKLLEHLKALYRVRRAKRER